MLEDAMAGGLAGLTVDLALFPLDTVKTWLQQRRGGSSAGGGAPSAPAPMGRLLYRGLSAALLVSAPSAALFFTVYEGCKIRAARVLRARGGAVAEAAAPALASCAAELATIALRTPFEVVKQRLQLGLHAGAGEALRALIAAGVSRGLLAGLGSTVLRDVPFAALQFSAYEALKARALEHAPPAASLSRFELAVAAATAAALAAAATTPLDVIKTRMMTQQLAPAVAGPAAKTVGAARAVGGAEAAPPAYYTSWRNAASRILREEGTVALFRGLRARVAMLSLGAIIYLGTYEEAKRQLVALGRSVR